MNEMYDMSIVTHYYGVIGVLLVIFINFFILLRSRNIKVYQRQMSLFTPIGLMAIVSVVFTGVVMMAAKHLDFTVENIVMIVVSIVFIFLEVMRVKRLKYIDVNEHNVLKKYRLYAIQIFTLETLMTLLISAWMLF